jgi:nucleoid-associated protein YgaU
MDLVEMLREDEDAILEEAVPAVTWLRHYGAEGEETARERLQALYRLVERAVADRDLDELLAHARRVARERFEAGYDRAEVVAAFSALEEAIWHQALSRLPEGERTWALGLVGTALSHAKEALVRAFAALAQGGQAPYVDMSRIFRGADTGRRDRFREDLVYPV